MLPYCTESSVGIMSVVYVCGRTQENMGRKILGLLMLVSAKSRS